jgi:hypothetical protein
MNNKEEIDLSIFDSSIEEKERIQETIEMCVGDFVGYFYLPLTAENKVKIIDYEL